MLIDPMPDTATPDTPDRYRIVDTRFSPSIDPDAAIDVSCFMSTDQVDEDNEVVLPGGCELGRFEKNGPLMLAHDWQKAVSYYPLPIGQVEWVKKRPHGLLGGIRFARGSEMGREVKALVDEEILRGVSVGMRVLDQSAMTRAEADSRADWQAAFARTKGRINVIRKWKLLELSVVPIPSNEDALIETLRVKGLSRPAWVAPAATATTATKEVTMNEPEVPDRDRLTATHPDAARLIQELTDPSDVRLKGTYLGELRAPALAAVVERLMASLASYLWSVVYDSRSTVAELDGKLRGACDEFRDAIGTVFGSLESLRTGPDLASAVGVSLRALSAAMSDPCKAAFGDPAAMLADADLFAKAASDGPGRGGDPDDDGDENADEDDDNDGPIRKGHSVKVVKGSYKGMVGKVRSVHRGELVPDVQDDVIGTKAEPAARVCCYKAMGDGHKETAHHIGVLCKHLEKTDDLKPPKRGKGAAPAEPEPEPVELGFTLDPAEVRTDEQVRAERDRAAVAAATSPEAVKTLVKAIVDELQGVV